MTFEAQERLLKSPAAEGWNRIGVRHHHGICLPLFALHSQQSGGIGEFTDLLPLLPWCKEIGLDVIQLLPLNDTGLDISPYNALSANALNPFHLALHALPDADKVPSYHQVIEDLREWNQRSRVYYAPIRDLKRAFLREYISLHAPTIVQSQDYLSFLHSQPWLEPYALFKSIKAQEKWRSWEEWPNQLKSPSDAAYRELLNEHKENIQFHSIVQYLCFKQFESVKKEAEKLGVFLKGDIPILISRDSADVWANRHYFLLHLAAGAPPDMYAKEGQYWGFPLYDWDYLEKKDYSWWKERLKAASLHYHLYRLDHIVGFFRIWGVPLNRSPKEGSFVPQNESEWIPHGKKIMEMMLKSVSMLPIGEDLGTVPPIVRTCLAELGICGTKVMRWERRWNEDGGYIPPSEYPAASMTTVSTHDSDTLQLWWRHSPKEAKLYCDFKKWDYRPFLSRERHQEILHDSHHSGSLFHINLLNEYLALFPELVSPNPNEERINIPGKILDTNWTYRFRPSIEELISHTSLKETMRQLIS